MAVHIAQLNFEHHQQNALGIGESKPRISWRFAGSSPSWIQTSYEVEIRQAGQAASEAYRVDSGESVLVPWPGHPLVSRQAVEVRVRACGGNAGNETPTPWSHFESVEAGLLQPTDWTAEWVEPKIASDPKTPHAPILFRKLFKLRSEIANARLYATAHGVYEVEINGKRVGDEVLAPGFTSYDHRLTYQTYDVTSLLNHGDNVIGAHVGEGWFTGRLGFHGERRNIWGTEIGFLGQLEITYKDGASSVVGSDGHWKHSSSSVTSSEIYNGETYDARICRKGWSSTGYDDSEWKFVKSSPIDLENLNLVPTDGPPVRRTQEVPALTISKSPSGKAIIDFGQNLVGWLRIQFPIAQYSGHTVTISHSEVLELGECARVPLRTAAAQDVITLTGDSFAWEPKFTFHGFRYAQIENWPSSTKLPTASDIMAIVVHTDMERTGWFECSDPLLNKLHQNIVWGMRGNFLSIPTDCPQRDERLGWTGDIHAFGPTATFLYNVNGMLSGWLRDLTSEQNENGGSVPPLVCPNALGPWAKMPSAFWSDCLIGTPWDIFQASSDVDLLRRQYHSMQKWLNDGVPKDERGMWHPSTTMQLGDWLDPNAPPEEPGNGITDPLLVANAFLIRMTEVMSQISRVLNLTQDTEKYMATVTALKSHFADDFITTSGRVVADSQTGLALAIFFSLFPTKKQEDVAAERLEFLIRAKQKFKIGTGFVGTPILGHALTKVGKSQLFYRMLLHKKNPSWLYSVTMGATTIWERWNSLLPDGSVNPGEMTSFNHYAFGSVADWMHQNIGGLSIQEPGWKKAAIRPIPGGSITQSKCSHLTPYGLVSCEWSIHANTFKMEIQVPPNTSAVVYLPGSLGTVHEVGSGKYTFEEAYEELAWPPLPIYAPFSPHDDDEP